MAFLKNYSQREMWWLKIMLEGWHVSPAVLKDHCWNVTLPLICAALPGMGLQIYMHGAQKKHRK